MKLTKVVVVGGGFGGVKAALELARSKNFLVTLISDHDYFLHHATLYATATGHSHKESVVSLASIFSDLSNVTVVKDSAENVDPTRKELHCKHKTYPYDKLILSLGMVTSYFNLAGVEQHSYGIKTLEEVTAFNRHLHTELVNDQHLKKRYVVVGGGPTGVELAAALSHYLADIYRAHKIQKADIAIDLVEAAPRILPTMSQAASNMVTAQLRKLAVNVLTNQKVQSLSDTSVTINGRRVASHTVIWTSGVANNPFYARHSQWLVALPNGRIKVDDYLMAHPHVYVIGDNAATTYSGTAHTALRHGAFVAAHLNRLARGNEPLPYTPKRYAVTVPVGSNWAIYEAGYLRIIGRFGYAIRRLDELLNYTQLLPFGRAIAVWHERAIREETCTTCKTMLAHS